MGYLFMFMRATVSLLATVIAGVLWPLIAQNSTPIWAGAYTAEQAERGLSVVQNHCGECHHEDLSGGEGPALAGPAFMAKWESHSVERLFHKIRDTMPGAGGTDVTDRQKLDTVAYILQQNGFPAGGTELTEIDSALGSLRIVPKGGFTSPRAGALVRTVGCLQETGASQWALTQSTDPQVTTLDPVSAAEKQSAALAPPGTQTIQLLSPPPNSAAIKGHKALAKGLFIKLPSGSRINVMSLESLAPDCEK